MYLYRIVFAKGSANYRNGIYSLPCKTYQELLDAQRDNPGSQLADNNNDLLTEPGQRSPVTETFAALVHVCLCQNSSHCPLCHLVGQDRSLPEVRPLIATLVDKMEDFLQAIAENRMLSDNLPGLIQGHFRAQAVPDDDWP